MKQKKKRQIFFRKRRVFGKDISSGDDMSDLTKARLLISSVLQRVAVCWEGFCVTAVVAVC